MAKTPTSGGISLGDLVWSIQSNDVSLAKGVKDSEKKMVGLGKVGKDVAKKIGIAFTIAGTAITAVFTKGLLDFIAFQEGMKNVAVLGIKDMAALMEGVKQLAIETGEDVIKLTDEVFKAISGGILEEAVLDVLAAAFEGATAGAGELKDALDAGTNIMNAYGLHSKDAKEETENFRKVMGQLAVAAKFGKTDISDLGKAVGDVAGDANEAGVTTEALLSILSALTKPTGKATSAVVGLRAVLTAVAKPTEEAKNLAKLLKIEFDGVALKAKGAIPFFNELVASIREINPELVQERDRLIELVKVQSLEKDQLSGKIKILSRISKLNTNQKKELAALKISFQDNNEELSKNVKSLTSYEKIGADAGGTIARLFGSQQAMSAILAFTGPLADSVAEAYDGMADSIASLEKMSKAYQEGNIDLALNQLKQVLKVLIIDLSEALVPILQDVLKFVKPILISIREWVKENPKLSAALSIITAAVGALMLVLGPLIILLPGIIAFFTTIVPLIGPIAGLLAGIGAAFAVFAAPMIAFVAVAGAGWMLGTWFDRMIDEWFPGFGRAIDSAMDKLVAFIEKIKEWIGLGSETIGPGANLEAQRAAFRASVAAGDISIPSKRPTAGDFSSPSATSSSSVSLSVSVGQLHVREEADIEAVSRKLGQLIEKKLRSRGRSFSIA